MSVKIVNQLSVEQQTEIDKIDSGVTDGLLGTSNSLTYRVHEIERHFHSMERWYGSDGDGTGSTTNNMTEWRLTAGSSSAFGTEVAILGTNDIKAADFDVTPVKFDIHRILVASSSASDKNYIIQLWGGATTFGEATLLTEVPYRVSASIAESTPVSVQMPRQAVASKIWARVKCETDAATLDLLIGVHVYQG